MRTYEARLRFHPGYNYARLMAWRTGSAEGYSWSEWMSPEEDLVPETIKIQLGLQWDAQFRCPKVLPVLIKKPRDLEMLFPSDRIIYGVDGTFVTLRQGSGERLSHLLSEQSPLEKEGQNQHSSA